MLIDPFTVIAQTVNFVILAFALKHFLYGRVIDAMDRREASIATRLSDAAEREEEARHEVQALRQERAQLDHDRHALLDRAREDADTQRQVLLDQAREEVENERHRWHRGLLAEQRELRDDLRRRTAHEVLELSRTALSDLAGVGLEADVLDRALDRLEHDDETRRALLGDRSTPLTVRTAFVVPHADRHALVERLAAMGLGQTGRVRFEHDPELVLGVELRVDGIAVAWNAHDYLERMAAALEELSAPHAAWGDDDE